MKTFTNVVSHLKRGRKALTNPSLLVDYIREPRDIVIGGIVPNALGLQVARTLAEHTSWLMRRSAPLDSTTGKYAKKLEQDGVVVIENFLPKSAFAQIQSEVKAALEPEHATIWRRYEYGDNFVSDQVLASAFPDMFPSFVRYLRDSEVITRLAISVARRQMTYKPHVLLQMVHPVDVVKPIKLLDANQFAHADRHYPFVKVFFYIEDVDESNAPYCYARGSHKITLKRLQHEYRFSLKHARAVKNGYGDDFRTQAETGIEMYKLNDAYLRSIGIPMEPITGKANTLIISNNQGFHRRGDFSGSGRRVMAVIDYKYLEARISQMLYPILKHVYAP